jgi:hypothetical protein
MSVPLSIAGEGSSECSSEPGEGSGKIIKEPLTRRLISFGATLSHKGRGFSSKPAGLRTICFDDDYFFAALTGSLTASKVANSTL